MNAWKFFVAKGYEILKSMPDFILPLILGGSRHLLRFENHLFLAG